MISNKPILVPNQNWRELVPSTEKHFNASYEKAMSFPKVNGIIESEKYVKMVDCACCGSSNSRQIFVKWNFIHSECNNCDHIYVKNQLRKEREWRANASKRNTKIDESKKYNIRGVSLCRSLNKKISVFSIF